MICAPKTKIEASAYSYGYHFNKRRYNPSRCAYETYPRDRGGSPGQCHRKPGHGPDALYCGQHAKIVEPRKP